MTLSAVVKLRELQQTLYEKAYAEAHAIVGVTSRQLLAYSKKFEESLLQAFDMAMRLASSMPQAHGNRAAVLQEMNRAGEALAAIDRALRLKPDHAPAHFNRGNILRVLHRREEAIRAFDQALRGQPKFIDAMLNRGMFLSDSGRELQARAEFNNSVDV